MAKWKKLAHVVYQSKIQVQDFKRGGREVCGGNNKAIM